MVPVLSQELKGYDDDATRLYIEKELTNTMYLNVMSYFDIILQSR